MPPSPDPAEHAAFHLPLAVLTERLLGLPPAPLDAGRVALVVSRPDAGARATHARCRLTPEAGVPGDRWIQRQPLNPDAQLAVMRADVASVIANGQPLALFGDNLLVELDLSLDNLPEGTRLRVGEAVCEVTKKPHTGCVKFAARFGQDARDLTGAETFKSWRLRGLYFRVVEAGDVAPGDRLEVLARP